MQMSTLTAKEQIELLDLIESDSRLRKLAKTAARGGPDGCFSVAEIAPEKCLVFEVLANEVRVLDIVPKRIIDALPRINESVETNGSHKKLSSRKKAIKV